MKKRGFFIFFLIFTYLISFLYRFFGLLDNPPFWVDEFSSANQAKLILKYGLSIFSNSQVFFEAHNITTHALIALSFKLFGIHEWSARLPFVFIGALVPIAVYFLAKYIFDNKTAIGAALLSTFSYFMITWSRQARGYVLLQLLVLISIFLYFKLIRSQQINKINVFLFLMVALLGLFTHFLYYILLISLAIHFIIFNWNKFKKLLKHPLTWLIVLLFIAITYKVGSLGGIINFIRSDSFGANNLWYYHSYLWRQYGLITFLTLLAAIIGWKKDKSVISLIGIYTISQVLFLSFILKPYVSRYLLSILPLLFIVASYSLTQITAKINRALPIILIIFIIVNGDKFVTKPKTFYSVNHDFREIALLDYNQVYSLIKAKGRLAEGKTAVIDTWHDRLYWYLGEDYPNAYIFRWINNPGLTNGLPMKTLYTTNSEGEKIIPRTNNLRFIGELKDLKKAVGKYPKGFIFIDDSTLPHDIIEYAGKNFKKELYLDHYPLDDNPYSIWPATLYSWGIQ